MLGEGDVVAADSLEPGEEAGVLAPPESGREVVLAK
jgi:hypothetical protein